LLNQLHQKQLLLIWMILMPLWLPWKQPDQLNPRQYNNLPLMINHQLAEDHPPFMVLLQEEGHQWQIPMVFLLDGEHPRQLIPTVLPLGEVQARYMGNQLEEEALHMHNQRVPVHLQFTDNLLAEDLPPVLNRQVRLMASQQEEARLQFKPNPQVLLRFTANQPQVLPMDSQQEEVLLQYKLNLQVPPLRYMANLLVEEDLLFLHLLMVNPPVEEDLPLPTDNHQVPHHTINQPQPLLMVNLPAEEGPLMDNQQQVHPMDNQQGEEAHLMDNQRQVRPMDNQQQVHPMGNQQRKILRMDNQLEEIHHPLAVFLVTAMTWMLF